ncbi:MAG TPA: DUF3857 domain-containing protein [Flavipsychrobacter sp.]|nr:DUF3857 domain-containing protein [Flavipsychrobacter sp.]
MKPVKILTTLFYCILLSHDILGQGVDKNFIKYHLSQTKYSIDPDAAAVVLYEKGTVSIEKVNGGNYHIVFHEYEVIKILKSSALDAANISLPYYTEGHNYIDNINGTTYNLDEHSNVAETGLSKSSTYNHRINDRIFEEKFTLPAVKEGSIIEYSYDKTSDMQIMLPRWYFQNDYPTLTSKYELIYPGVYEFTSEIQGHGFKEYPDEDDAIKHNDPAYHITSLINMDQNYSLWVRHNTPAAKEEPYISSIENDIELIQVQLSTINRSDGDHEKIINTWDKLNKELWKNEKFGKQVSRANNFFEPSIDTIATSNRSDLDKAKTIFSYIRSNIECTGNEGITAEKDIEDVLNNKKGSESEINLLLTAMLRKIGLDASPLILSTVGNLRAHDIYPLVNSFNYTACVLTVDSQKYYLDASNKYNMFGILPSYCYNGYCRIINKEGGSANLTSDDINDREISLLNVSGVLDSITYISCTKRFGNITSRKLREKWTRDNQASKNYISELIQGMPGDMTIIDSKVENLNNPDTGLVIRFKLGLKNKTVYSIYYLNTEFNKTFKENPFKSSQRKLPVEFPYKIEKINLVNYELPKNYHPEDLPKPSLLKYEDGEIEYEKDMDYDTSYRNTLTIRTHFQNRETTYPVIAYETLRTFFEKMIQEENAAITLKKN